MMARKGCDERGCPHWKEYVLSVYLVAKWHNICGCLFVINLKMLGKQIFLIH